MHSAPFRISRLRNDDSRSHQISDDTRGVVAPLLLHVIVAVAVGTVIVDRRVNARRRGDRVKGPNGLFERRGFHEGLPGRVRFFV